MDNSEQHSTGWVRKMLRLTESLDTGHYTPKGLAAKEHVSTAAVYAWIHKGLPYRRRGERGTISIYYPDYVRWTTDAARREAEGGIALRRLMPQWAVKYVNEENARADDSRPEEGRMARAGGT